MALTKIKTGSVSDSITLTTPDINGGTIDATVIGGTTPAVATFTDVVAASLDISGNIDVDGTSNLDVVDIDGAVDLASTVSVSGPITINAGSYFIGNGSNGFRFNNSSDAQTLFYVKDAGEAVFNDNSIDYDFRVESDTNTHALFVEGSTGRLFSGGSATSSSNTWSVLSGSQYIKKAGTAVYDVLQFYNDNGICGQIYVNGSSTVYATSSDYRIKENVVPMTGSIDRVKALKPSRFNFIVDADRTVDGFIAHEVQAVVPEAISGTKDAMKDEEYEVTAAVLDDEGLETTAAVMGTRSVPDMQGIDQSKLVPLLVAALQEAIARIEILEGA